jgi:hypothetical protein
MPPQQAECLLDIFDRALDFGAQDVPLSPAIWAEQQRL